MQSIHCVFIVALVAVVIDSAGVLKTPRFALNIPAAVPENSGSIISARRHHLLVRRFQMPWMSSLSPLPGQNNIKCYPVEHSETGSESDQDVPSSTSSSTSSSSYQGSKVEYDEDKCILLESDDDDSDITETQDWKEGRTVNGRYRLLNIIGFGSYGAVVKALDIEAGTHVAVKIMFSLLPNERSRILTLDGKRWEVLDSTTEAQNELDAYRVLGNRCDHCMKMLDSFQDDEATYIVMPLMTMSLFDAIRSPRLTASNSFASLHSYFVDIKINLNKVRRISRQLFEGLECMHDLGVVHNDLKPENILIDRETKQLRIIDFSFACPVDRTDEWPHVTAWFEDPLISLHGEGSEKSDIWSAGLVLAEILYGHAILPYNEIPHRLYGIQLLLGLPELPDRNLQLSRVFGTSRWKFMADEEMTRQMHEQGGHHVFTHSNFLTEYQWSDDSRQLSDLILECLRWDPEDRPSATQALKHPFFRKH